MNSIIYNELLIKHIKKFEKSFNNIEKQKANSAFEKLEQLLKDDNEGKRLLHEYDTCLKSFYETMRDDDCAYCLNKGIQIGLELSKSFQQIEDDENEEDF